MIEATAAQFYIQSTLPWLVVFGCIYILIQINRICYNVGEKSPHLGWHLVYEFYLTVVTLGTSIFFVLPGQTIWKGRKY